MAEIYSIMVKPELETRGKQDHSFDRVLVPEASLEIGQGIQGDAKGGRHPDRQLSILTLAWVEGLKSEGYITTPGSFGEQLMISGLNVDELGSGEHLALGEDAVIEITKPRLGCERLEAAQQDLPFAGEKVGILARFVRGGVIRVGDPVLKGE